MNCVHLTICARHRLAFEVSALTHARVYPLPKKCLLMFIINICYNVDVKTRTVIARRREIIHTAVVWSNCFIMLRENIFTYHSYVSVGNMLHKICTVTLEAMKLYWKYIMLATQLQELSGRCTTLTSLIYKSWQRRTFICFLFSRCFCRCAMGRQ